ncbi:MAG TPA: hypothetical protein VFS16_18340 [Acidimicrobiia bacterium]|nr:hypothetical protein [Acidimicrobiia bacterium]
MARRISVALLGLGAALIWPVPLGGALVMLTGALGLAVAMEDDLISDGLIPAQIAPPSDPRLS